MKRFYLNCALLAMAGSVLAQNSPKDGKTEKLYDNLGYAKYAELRGQGNMMDYSNSVLDRMGTSYRKIGDTKNAEIIYGMLVENESERPEHYLYYAQALQSNMKYREAKTYFLLYDKMATKNSSETKPYNGAGKVYAQACERISQFKAVGDVKIRNEREINSARLDFSPMYYKDGIVFVSTRGQQKKNFMDKWINDRFMDLYYAPAGQNGLEKSEQFDRDLNSKYHEGPVSFVDGEQTIYFTRNNYLQGKRGHSKDKITKLKIYTARKVNDRWDEVRDLWFNSSEIDVCHPALSRDGKVFVFSRSSGNDGFGGMDLYVSFQLGNKWTAPKNLGPNINTAGNEVFPYIADDGTLFFASNGLAGLGGLDVFLADKLGAERDSLWGYPLNLGAPFNSSTDDFGFIINPQGTEGYFTSNREGGMGGDDIYSFKATPNLNRVLPRPTRPMTICVYDVQTSKRIADAQVRIRPASSNPAASNGQNLNLSLQNGITINLSPIKEGSDEYVLKLSNGNGSPSSNPANGFVTATTDRNGTCQHFLPAGEEYVFEVLKNGYELASQTYTLSQKDFNGDLAEFCIPLSKGNGNGNLANNGNPNGNNPNGNFNPAQLWANGAILSNPNFSNNPNEPKNPNYTKVPPDPSNPYNLPATILNVPDDQPQLSAFVFNKEYNRPLPNTKVTILNRCTGEEKLVTVGEDGVVNYEMECGCDYVIKASKDKFIGSNRIINLSDKRNCQKLIPVELPMTPGFDKLGEPIVIGGNTINSSIKEGDLIELKNIFYDYDKFAIRQDASQDLDELYGLMLRFPSMEIELASHTDSRGTDQYNRNLSSNRAKYAKEYLVKKGISSTRIKAVGYGESRTRNGCNDGVDCSEFEHQRNRRTEVFVTKFDESEFIKVKYDDNAPRVIDEKKN